MINQTSRRLNKEKQINLTRLRKFGCLRWDSHLWPYCNILPGAVYCCFTRTTLFTELVSHELSHHQVLLL